MSDDNSKNPATMPESTTLESTTPASTTSAATTPQLHRGQKDVLAANYSYITTLDKTDDGKYKELPEGLINTQDIEVFQKAGIHFVGLSDFILGAEDNSSKMRSVIFLNEDTKELTIAIAGTRVDGGMDKAFADLTDDLRLSTGNMPSKLAAVEKINDTLIGYLKKLNFNKLEDYKFHFTGHSLGAVMADCAAADMALRLQHVHSVNLSKNQVSTVTFDNPGATKLVKKICEGYQKAHPGNSINIDELKKTTSFKAINNRPNFINTLDEQVGEKFTMVPHDQKPLSGFSLMCQHIGHKLYNIPILGYIVKILSMGDPREQIQDHSIANFHNVIVTQDNQQKGHFRSKDNRKMLLDEVITGIEPIQYEQEIFDKIKDIRKDENEGKVEGKYSMLQPDTQERIEFSKEQMARAMIPIDGSKASETYKKQGWYEILQEAKFRIGKATGLPLGERASNDASYALRTAVEVSAEGKGYSR